MRKIMLVLSVFVLAACNAGPAAQVGAANTTAQPVDGGVSNRDNTISVSGTGQVMGHPDTVVVDLGVSVLRPNVDSATSTAAELARAVIDALIGEGVIEDDIQTTNYSLWPEYDYSNEQQRIVGYRVSNTVRAKIRDVASAGAVIDAAVVAGGSDTVVNGVSFDLEQNRELIAAAREAAWSDALAKAEQLAELAGVVIDRTVTITETTSQSSPPIMYGDEAMTKAATPIQAGQQSVSVIIQVVFGFVS